MKFHIKFPSRETLMEAPASINFNAGYKSLDLKLIDVSVQIEGILPLTFIKHILR